MSDTERGDCRAQGAFALFVADMKTKLECEGRSPEYVAAFWDNLRNVASDFAHDGKV